MSDLNISVVITTWKRSASLRNTLDSLATQSSECEVIVVCDGEDDDTRALSRSYDARPVRWIFHEKNLGLPAARNTGAREARGEVVLFLDDDVIAGDGLVEFHRQAHVADPRLAVCGKIVESSVRKQNSKVGEFLEQDWQATLRAFDATRMNTDTDRLPVDAVEMSCFGLNCSLRRSLFVRMGGFHPELHFMDEEMEFGQRLYLAGVRFAFKERAVVQHRNDKDLTEYFRRCWWLGGKKDVLRAFKWGQRTPQTRAITTLDHGPALSKLANRLAWRQGGAMRGVSGALERTACITGSKAVYRLWHRVAQSQLYWDGVRESGISRHAIRATTGTPVRVLLLHSISEPQHESEQSYYLSPNRFRRLLKVLKDGGYRCVDPSVLKSSYEFGEREYVLTFDDGYDDFYTEVFPLIEQYGLKPLVFLPAARIGGENLWDQASGLRARKLLTLEQVRELMRYGVRFGSHTLTHPSLPSVDDRQLKSEVEDSRHQLEDLLGEQITTFAYPYGDVNRRVRSAVIEAGYEQAFTTVPGLNVWQEPYAIQRSEINELDAPYTYSWKVRTGLSPFESFKYEVRPVLDALPGRVRRPLLRAWKKARGISTS